MGSQISGLAAEDIEDLQASTHFNEKEILRLYKRFKTLDRDHSGTLSTDELLSIPEFAMNPLVPTRLMAIIAPGGREVSFKGFLQILSVFHPRASADEKLKFAFKVYDIDDDGRIGESELTQVLQLMVGAHLTEEELSQVVKQILSVADPSGKGFIDYGDFRKSLEQSCDIENIMTI